MNLGAGIIAAISLGVGIWLYWHKDAPKFTTFLFLVAGLFITGGLWETISKWMNSLLHTGASTTAGWIGVGATAVLATIAVVATLEVFVKGMWKKKAKPKRWHPFLALSLGLIISASGVPILVKLMTLVHQGAGSASAVFGG